MMANGTLTKITSFWLVLVLGASGLLAGCSRTGEPPTAQATPPPQDPAPLPATSTPTLPPLPTATRPPTAEPTATPTVPPDLQEMEDPGLLSLWMLTEQAGWGTSAYALYRTQDGGLTWQEVTPPEQRGGFYQPAAFFLDSSTGWALYPAGAEGLTGLLHQTVDGGASWSLVPVEFPFAQLHFIDANNGWALNASDCGAGSCGGKLYRTQDGGATWQAIAAIEPGEPDAPGRLPFSGSKTGIAFVDRNRGWVTGSVPMEGFVYLYRTDDGGLTWQPQELSLPPEYASTMLTFDPPRFFSPTEGILPVLASGENSARLFFTTQDAGQTWAATTPAPSGLFDFISISEGWVWGLDALRLTLDGGQSWLEIPPNINLSRELLQIDFVTRQAGWATTIGADGDLKLYRSLDGGITWAP